MNEGQRATIWSRVSISEVRERKSKKLLLLHLLAVDSVCTFHSLAQNCEPEITESQSLEVYILLTIDLSHISATHCKHHDILVLCFIIFSQDIGKFYLVLNPYVKKVVRAFFEEKHKSSES